MGRELSRWELEQRRKAAAARRGDDAGAQVGTVGGSSAHLRERFIRCGKPRCWCALQEPGHGPYLYLVWREGTRVRERYVGKVGAGKTAKLRTKMTEALD